VKLTLPIGVPLALVTLAVKFTFAPATALVGSAVSLVLAVAMDTASGMVFEHVLFSASGWLVEV
jgi:hypothetical protein